MPTYCQQLFERAQNLMPGGVNSPVRSFKGVGGEPIFFRRGKGAYLLDVDDRTYIDYVGSWGPLILGHGNEKVKEAISSALFYGITFGAPSETEIKLAEKIIQHMPAIEKIRFVNSGTEATMTAIRLARGVTGRDKIIKFIGCYHGHHDSLLAKAGSGLLTLAIPATPGIPHAVTQDTLLADFNDLRQTAQLFGQHAKDIAAIIVEPIAGNMGLVLPDADFLPGLRRLCDQYGSLLIFDEVMTGFRVALGGAQGLYNIKPDITTLGKIIGGGVPVGAVGGKAEILDALAPSGPIYQAGTFSGNPLAMRAGLAALTEVEKPGFYEKLSRRTAFLTKGLARAAESRSVGLYATSVGGMFGICFTRNQVRNYGDVASSQELLFNYFFLCMLHKGIYFAPSMYEAGFVSSAHRAKDINKTISVAETIFDKLKGIG